MSSFIDGVRASVGFERRLAVLVAIRDLTAEKGYPPTMREIGQRVGLSSPSSVHWHCEALQALRYITAEPAAMRTIRLTEAGEMATLPWEPPDATGTPLTGRADEWRGKPSA